MSSVADVPTENPSASAAIFTRHAWLRRLRALICGAEGSSRACRMVIAGFFAGTFLLFDDWMRILWLTLAAPVAILFMDWRATWRSLREDSVLILGMHFLCWMTVRSLAGYGMVDGEDGMAAATWLLGTLLLAVFGILVWKAAENAFELESLGHWVGMVAAFAAVVSFVLFYFVLPGHVFGERFMNFFVYGGWNPVSTGLTFGFAAMWLACLQESEGSRRWWLLTTGAIVILLVAVCFTRSRGALLALAAAHLVLTWSRGLARTWLNWALLLGAVALFAFSGPIVRRVAEWQSQSRIAPSGYLVSMQPVAEMMTRGDAGRIDLYQRALQSFTGPERWIFGVGQWGPEEACCRSLARLHYHLHSGYFATLVHGGLIGLGLVLTVLGIAMRRAVALARDGQDTWAALLAYGCAGLVFDGQAFTSVTSMPQMETMIFSFPLIATAAIWWHQRSKA